MPALRVIHDLRWKLTGIFDERRRPRTTAAAEIAAWWAEAWRRARTGVRSWDCTTGTATASWPTSRGVQSSGPVEGLNNKARVIIKRSYGLKSCETLWTRLILDVNWVRERIGKTVAGMHALANRIWAAFCGRYT